MFMERDSRRGFNQTEKAEIWDKQEGKCARCREQLLRRATHYDHIIPWEKEGKTNVKNGQALCANCHSIKSHEARLDKINNKGTRPTPKSNNPKESEELIKDSSDISISDLIRKQMLKVGEKLVMEYKPRQGNKKEYVGYLNKDGAINLFGQNYSTPSYAALVGIQKAGSNRKTVNGWTSWKNAQGKTLDDLRKLICGKNIPSLKPEDVEPEGTKSLKSQINKEEKIAIFANYKRKLYKATYYSRYKIVFNGKKYLSPTAACKAVTKNSTCNGLTFWRFMDKNGKEQKLKKLN